MADSARDYTNERSSYRHFFYQVYTLPFALNAWGPFQALNDFAGRCASFTLGLIPFTSFGYNRDCYVENTVRLTRYKSQIDNVL